MERMNNEQTIYNAALYCMVNQLIERIEIGHSQKVNGVRKQEITIVYRFVGKVED